MKPGNVILSLLVVLALLVLVWARMRYMKPEKKPAFKRNPARIAYSTQALCRMDCYSLDANDITRLFKTGVADLSAPAKKEKSCPVFILKGNVKGGMNLNIEVRQCGNVATVLTCQLLSEIIACDCAADRPGISFIQIKNGCTTC